VTAQMATVCAPSHPLAAMRADPAEDWAGHQLVVTDNQPDGKRHNRGRRRAPGG